MSVLTYHQNEHKSRDNSPWCASGTFTCGAAVVTLEVDAVDVTPVVESASVPGCVVGERDDAGLPYVTSDKPMISYVDNIQCIRNTLIVIWNSRRKLNQIYSRKYENSIFPSKHL